MKNWKKVVVQNLVQTVEEDQREDKDNYILTHLDTVLENGFLFLTEISGAS